MTEKDDIVIGLMFGDEGKGTTVDFLSTQKEAASVVRFSGGAQAAHNVVMYDGTHHTFAQFGAASFRGVPTTLSRFMMVNPFSLVEEGDRIAVKSDWNPFPSLNISENSLMTSPVHIWLNRRREELRGGKAHGSCGVGIGETKLYSLRNPETALTMKDLEYSSKAELEHKLQALQSYAESEIGEAYIGKGAVPAINIVESLLNLRAEKFLNIVPDRQIARILSKGYHIFEGSQGVLLDEWSGFHPHTTWSETTSKNAQKLLEEAGKPAGKVIGVSRSYLTRHGYGPFPSEISWGEGEAKFPENHNKHGDYQGGWRVGMFDPHLFKYAVRANGGVDELSITHMDRVNSGGEIVTSYGDNWPHIPTDFFGENMELKQEVTETLMNVKPLTSETVTKAELLDSVSSIAEARVSIMSHGPTSDDKVLA